MTDLQIRLAEIRQRVEKTTQIRHDAIWVVDPDDPTKVLSSHNAGFDGSIVARALSMWEDDSDHADAIFVAHARQDVPALLSAVEAVLTMHEPWCLETCGGMCSPDTCAVRKCRICELTTGLETAWPCPTVKAISEALGVTDA
jgi:hypothetical protein